MGIMMKTPICFALVFLCLASLYADDTQALPLISQWRVRDPVYLQYRRQIDALGPKLSTMTEEQITESLTVFAYRTQSTDDFFVLAAPTSIETLATINRLEHPSLGKEQRALLLPVMRGLFIPDNPVSDLEKLMFASRAGNGVPLLINGEAFHFIREAKFNSNEFAFFLDVNGDFAFPLTQYRISSDFGYRVNPVSGIFRMHEGLDLAAPAGTEVFAARTGSIIELGYNAIFGNYIVIQHSDGWSSLYGHLSKIETTLHSAVQKGTLIGRVGSTGQSTGPHLHFELRKDGKAFDPKHYLSKVER
ncbi:MAG: M23 family metallopeptidase [Spirochaetaceae bacterium]|jgi:murein DD-endopeptidase MepM/ murein hydrolase activator NlpD|nr:M23 family metallopeptidase [Spirochaetaceae bacterium]